MKGQFMTDTGKVRSHNEDAGGIFYNSSGQFLAIIADGMGGHLAGDVASQMAINIIKEKWQECKELHSPDETEKWLTSAVTSINQSIHTHSLQNEECQGMGTTIVIAVCIKDFLTIAHIGDSRCYVYDEKGLKQITEDHSLVNALVQSGQISKDEAQQHPRKNVVLRALGTEEDVVADVKSLGLDQGNRLLLCSDGLTDKVRDDEIAEYLHDSKEIGETAQQLINLANDRGGEDNISLIIIHEDSSVKEGDLSC
ncbi:Stp1/IreP family PP2C-type Ser/Thr phosphatase [Virgibacillus ainsalahensis]